MLINCILFFFFFGLVLLEMLKTSLDIAEQDTGAERLTESSRLLKRKKKERQNQKTEMGFSLSSSHRMTC